VSTRRKPEPQPPTEWAVLEFDTDQAPIWSAGPFTEEQARAHFAYVARGRSQRSDVVLRSRSAALVHRGKIVEACSIRRSRRAPLLGNKRLHHLDVDSREAIIGLELLAARLARASLRRDGTPRMAPGWAAIRDVVTEVWTLVRGASAAPSDGSGWWLREWECGCTQVERDVDALPDVCPYHAAPRHRATAYFVEG
jgi:hypothetical protein